MSGAGDERLYIHALALHGAEMQPRVCGDVRGAAGDLPMPLARGFSAERSAGDSWDRGGLAARCGGSSQYMGAGHDRVAARFNAPVVGGNSARML